jgi:hypothetical protein
LNPVEEDIRGRMQIVQLDSSTKRAGSELQAISFGPSPGAPFDDYDEAVREKLLT